jgi:hypothetical protein
VHQVIFCFRNRFYRRVELRHYARNRKVTGSSPDDIGILHLPDPSSRARILGLKGGRPDRKADNLTSICELIVYKMWGSRRPATGIAVHFLPLRVLNLLIGWVDILYGGGFWLIRTRMFPCGLAVNVGRIATEKHSEVDQEQTSTLCSVWSWACNTSILQSAKIYTTRSVFSNITLDFQRTENYSFDFVYMIRILKIWIWLTVNTSTVCTPILRACFRTHHSAFWRFWQL